MRKQGKTNARNTAKSRNYSSKGKRGNKDKEDLKSKSNDPKWYSIDPVILRDAASFPFAHPAGHPIYLGRDNKNVYATIPGVAAMDLIPTIGDACDASSPINIAATQTYAFIRHGNSGSVNYDAGDIMLYFLGMSEVYSYLEYLKRIYGVAQIYAQRNRYMPYTIMQAMKVDPISVEYNLANFRLGINMLINKVASFAVPNTMSLFNRRAFLYQNIYTESDNVKDQLYLFTPHAFSVYEWRKSKLQVLEFTPESISTYLGEDPVATNKYFTVNQLLDFGNRMVDLIISNEDLGTMNGDILKVYGDNIIKVGQISEDFTCVPLVDTLVLEQFKNATIVDSSLFDLEVFDVVSTYTEDSDFQGVSILSSHPYIKVFTRGTADVIINDTVMPKTEAAAENMMITIKAATICNNKLLDTSAAESTPELVMELTRLSPTFSHAYSTDVIKDSTVPAPATLTDYYYLASGTEIPVAIRIFNRPSSLTKNMPELKYNQSTIDYAYANLLSNSAYMLPDVYTPTKIQCVMNRIYDNFWNSAVACTSFKYLPNRMVYDGQLAFNAIACGNIDKLKLPVPTAIEGQVTNYTVITPEQLNKLHSVAMLNEFATPHVAILK